VGVAFQMILLQLVAEFAALFEYLRLFSPFIPNIVSSRCLRRRRGFFVAHEGYFRAPVTSKYNFMATCNNRCDVRFEIRPRFISSNSPPIPLPPLFDSIFLSPIRVQSNVFPSDFPHPSLLHDFAYVILSAATFRSDCNRDVLCSCGLERIPAI